MLIAASALALIASVQIRPVPVDCVIGKSHAEAGPLSEPAMIENGRGGPIAPPPKALDGVASSMLVETQGQGAGGQAEAPLPSPPEESAPAPAPAPAPADSGALPGVPSAPSDEGEYEIGPEDILKVTVYGHDDLTQTIVVQSDGSLVFPLVGRLEAAGLTPGGLAEKIRDRLAHGLVRAPQVTVVVQEYRSKTVFVVGEVAKPGAYPLAGRLTLIELLAKAALTANASTEVLIVRPVAPGAGRVLPAELGGLEGQLEQRAEEHGARVQKVNLREIQLGRVESNILLRPNDTVFVPPAGKIYVLGEVRNPGAYTHTPGLTVRQAISMAGGFTPDAATRRVRIIRDTARRPKDEIKAELEATLQVDDTIVVKGKLF